MMARVQYTKTKEQLTAYCPNIYTVPEVLWYSYLNPSYFHMWYTAECMLYYLDLHLTTSSYHMSFYIPHPVQSIHLIQNVDEKLRISLENDCIGKIILKPEIFCLLFTKCCWVQNFVKHKNLVLSKNFILNFDLAALLEKVNQ